MTLDIVDRVIYSKGCVTRFSNQVLGTYNYEKNGGSINLLGEIKQWTENSEFNKNFPISLYEFNNSFEKIAVFKGIFSDTTFYGTWINLSSQKSLPFRIKFENKQNQGLKIKWEGNTYILNEIITNSDQNTFTCLDRVANEKNLFLIYRVTKPYCGLYNCRGMNCGSREEYLHLYIISKEKQLSYFKKLTVNVDEEIETISIKSNKSILYVEIDGKTKYSIDYQNPSKGIVETK